MKSYKVGDIVELTEEFSKSIRCLKVIGHISEKITKETIDDRTLCLGARKVFVNKEVYYKVSVPIHIGGREFYDYKIYYEWYDVRAPDIKGLSNEMEQIVADIGR